MSNTTAQPTPVLDEFLSEVDTGAFHRQLTAFLQEVAGSVSRLDKPGKLMMQFDIKPAKNTAQTGAGSKVTVIAKSSYMRPTNAGKIAEESTSETPMWINKDNSITLLAKSHQDMFSNDNKVASLNK
ncbi:hypothetical protein [Neptunicella sp.]|uniref:hypothetical protein n=1 Tax=Neptunicella sp. TaxID=2125986 RepID=UPI003F6929BF